MQTGPIKDRYWLTVGSCTLGRTVCLYWVIIRDVLAPHYRQQFVRIKCLLPFSKCSSLFYIQYVYIRYTGPSDTAANSFY